jgi:hypothetical protein
MSHFYRIAKERPVLSLMLAAAVVMGVAETVVGYRLTVHRGLLDPDNYMRIVRIRDGLQTDWLTHIVKADNGGAGTVVYWSHLIDALVLALQAPLKLVLGDQAALFYAAAATGPVVAAALAAAFVWVVAPLAHARWLWTAPLIAAFSPLIFISGTFGYVHHHLPLALVCVLAAACAGRATAGRTVPGFWCGICSAVGVWISPEGLPFVLMAMGAIGVAWCLRPAALARPLAMCGTAFAAATTVAMLADPPYGGRLTPEIDCISIVYAVLSVLVGAAACFLPILGRQTASAALRFLYCVLTCAAVIGLWLWLYPDLTHGLQGLAPTSDAAAFFSSIQEMRPLRVNAQGVLMLMTGTLGVLVAFGLAFQTRNLLWSYAAGCGIVILALAIAHIRFAIYAQAIGALMLPVVMEFAGRSRLSPARQGVLRTAVLMTFLWGPYLPVLAAVLWGPYLPALAAEVEHSSNPMAECHVRDIVPVLLDKKNAIVLTEISDTPEILWRTPVRTVGSLYHRSIEAFLRARDAWRSTPSDTVPHAVLATGATHILACDSSERTFVADLPPMTLQARLAHHDVPPWLHEVGRAGGYRLYAVD